MLCTLFSYRYSLLFLWIFCISALASSAQEDSTGQFFLWKYVNSILNDTTAQDEAQLLVYPTIGYAPETSWELGFSTLYVFYANEDTTNRLSEVSGFTFYTLENQYGIWFDHALYSDQDKWFFLGRSRFQSFPLQYYGIGPDSPSEFSAVVEGNYLLLRERVLRKVTSSFYIGASLDYQNLYNVNLLGNEGDAIPSMRGSDGSANLGMGLSLVYDNRHNVLNVRDGLFSELSFTRYDKAWSSDFSFTNITFDTRWFYPVNKRDVLATQLLGQFNTAGNPPFNQLALLGGENIMRGYYLGRYRDDYLLAAQVEYRMLPLPFAKRFGAAAFLATGEVFSDEDPFRFSRLLPTGGVGGRFLLFPEKDIWVRIDAAFTEEGPGFYFFIGEAF